MPKRFLPENRKWTQPNDGSGTIRCAFNMDFDAHRGKVRVSTPLRQIFDTTHSFSGAGETFDGYANSLFRYKDNYWAMSDTVFIHDVSGVVSLYDKDDWTSDNESGSPHYGNTVGGAVSWNDKVIVIDNTASNGILKRWNNTSWGTYWGSGGTISKTSGRIQFVQPSQNGNLYVLDEDNYVHKVEPDDTADFADATSPANQGTLDFSDRPFEFTCTGDNSTRLFIGYRDKDTNRGGIIEWDRSAQSVTANKIHKLGAIPRVICIWDDLAIAILSNGKVKYFNGVKFVDFPKMRLPKISGKYDDDFVHPNGWAIIDDMPHFLIKGNKSIPDGSSYEKSTQTDLEFPSAVYCLDPEVGLYPRYALTNNTGTETEYSLPAVADVGALLALEEDESKFLASYDIYTNTSGSTRAVLAYNDETVSTDGYGFILFEDIERAKETKNIELIHRLIESGNSISAYYQEYDVNDQFIDGVWFSGTQFNTTDSFTVDDKWLAWVKTGKGAGQFLRISDSDTSNTTKTLTLKDTNAFVSKNDQATLQLVKFRWFGDITGTTLDYHTLSLPSEARSRKVRILLTCKQTAGTKNELDYGIIDT